LIMAPLTWRKAWISDLSPIFGRDGREEALQIFYGQRSHRAGILNI
jgi:hypothetical protein